ncbi:hypothetical protein FOA52_014605 [Chlamydomonas sp. UWO 241]|nr:hypothetical protein FOA52_014605 [Chlamydomonas sp. UWO 241]
MGDPVSISSEHLCGHVVPPGAALAAVQWSGFSRTASDELYHAVWAHSQGSRTVTLPFAATVEGVNPVLQAQPDELLSTDVAHWVVRVRVQASDFARALAQGSLAHAQPARA